MADVKISQLPAGSANASAVVPATNAAGTTTQKVTMGAIAALGGGPPAAHASTHATGGTDAVANVVNSPAQITADQNDYTLPAADIVRLTADAARTITGFAAGSSGQAVLLMNVSASATITLKHQSTSSQTANRIIVPWQGDYVIEPVGGSALLVYDATNSRWRVV